jgi:hypothetical protein
MWQLYIYSFLAGLFAANGVPHFIKGTLGQKHQTPFGKSSSAVVNVAWGAINFIIAVIFLHFGHIRSHEDRAFIALAVGGLLISLFNARIWSKHPEYNK